MAWTRIDYACGHAGEVQLYGPGASRDREKDRLAKQDCPDCYKDRRKREIAAASAQAAEANADMPRLEGSEKQIAWAETIRASAKECIAEVLGISDAAKLLPMARRIISQKSAKYWIDHRMEFSSTTATANYIIRRTAEEAAKLAGSALLQPKQIQTTDVPNTRKILV